MNGSKGNAASNASELPDRRDIVFNLNVAYRMLPLVKRVVDDILIDRKALAAMEPERARLDRQKRDLVWQERQRRYQVHAEVANVEQHLQDALDELRDLGVTVLDQAAGQVGFPTLVNDMRAYFTWQPGEETLISWQFAEETGSRPIPQVWWKVAETSLSGKN
jgi:hypothetical protein